MQILFFVVRVLTSALLIVQFFSIVASSLYQPVVTYFPSGLSGCRKNPHNVDEAVERIS